MNDSDPIIRTLAEKIPDLQAVYLFGSRAEGTARKDSDYDIAFLTDRPGRVSGLEAFEIGVALSSVLETRVDLIDFYSVPIDLRFEVVVNGIRIFCSDIYFCDLYETTVISMYQRFELERRDLVAAYKERMTNNA